MKKTTIPFLLLLAVAAFIAFQSEPGFAANEDEFVGTQGPAFHAEEWISSQPEMEGKYLLVDFWATWCGPCLRAIPHMNELHATFKDKLTVVGLSREPRSKVESMSSPTMDYYSAIDTQGKMGSFFKIRSIPHVVLMDPKGVVLYKGHPANLTVDKVRELLSKS